MTSKRGRASEVRVRRVRLSIFSKALKGTRVDNFHEINIHIHLEAAVGSCFHETAVPGAAGKIIFCRNFAEIRQQIPLERDKLAYLSCMNMYVENCN